MIQKNIKSYNQEIVGLFLGAGLGLVLLKATTMSSTIILGIVGALCLPFLLLVFSAERLLLGFMVLEIPFKIDILFFHNPEYKSLGLQAGLYLSLTTLCLIPLYGIWFAKKVLGKADRSPTNLRAYLSAGAYVLVAFITLLFAPRTDFAIYQCMLLLQMFFLFIYIGASVRTREDLIFVIALLIGGVLAESLIIIALKLTGSDFKIMGIIGRNDNGRIGGTIGSPNAAGMYFAFLLPLTGSLLLTKLKSQIRLFGLVTFVLGAVALVFTLSRGSWISVSIAISFIYFFAFRRKLVSLKFLAFTVLTSGIFLLAFHEKILSRFFGDDGGSAQSRFPLMKVAFQIIGEHPIWGVGTNNYVVAMQPFATALEMGKTWVYAVHNFYLLTFAETGIVGLMVLLWFIFSCIKRGLDCWSFNDPFLSPIGLAIAASFVGEAVHMLVDVYNGPGAQKLLFFFAGLLIAIHRIGKTDITPTNPTFQPPHTDRAIN